MLFHAIRAKAVVATGDREEAADVHAVLLPYADRLAGISNGPFVLEPAALRHSCHIGWS